MKSPSKQPCKQRKIVSGQGFTLAEVMIGTVIFTIAMLAMLSTTTLAYKNAMKARYEERAANALLSIADQFQNSPINDKQTGNKKVLFQTANTNTGTGMAWDSTRQVFGYPGSTAPDGTVLVEGVDDTTNGLTVPLNTVGDSANGVVAHIFRQVSDRGDPYPLVSTPSSGQVKMLEGIFTANYTFFGDQKITIKVLRTVTPSDLSQ